MLIFNLRRVNDQNLICYCTIFYVFKMYFYSLVSDLILVLLVDQTYNIQHLRIDNEIQLFFLYLLTIVQYSIKKVLKNICNLNVLFISCYIFYIV